MTTTSHLEEQLRSYKAQRDSLLDTLDRLNGVIDYIEGALSATRVDHYFDSVQRGQERRR